MSGLLMCQCWSGIDRECLAWSLLSLFAIWLRKASLAMVSSTVRSTSHSFGQSMSARLFKVPSKPEMGTILSWYSGQTCTSEAVCAVCGVVCACVCACVRVCVCVWGGGGGGVGGKLNIAR